MILQISDLFHFQSPHSNLQTEKMTILVLKLQNILYFKKFIILVLLLFILPLMFIHPVPNLANLYYSKYTNINKLIHIFKIKLSNGKIMSNQIGSLEKFRN